MPAAVRTPEEEADWARAKQIVSEQYPEKARAAANGGDKSSFYALVMTVYKDIQKGRDKTESFAPEEVRNALILLRRADGNRADPDALEVQVESAKLKPGDAIVIVTKTGRTMGEGTVVDASAEQVTVRTGDPGEGVDFVRSYATDIYSFMKKVERKPEPTLGEGAPDEAEVPEIDHEDAGEFPITHSGTYDMAGPAVEIVRKYISDRRLAYAFWIDMTSRGAEWAARRHDVDQDKVDAIVTALTLADLLPSSVTRVGTDMGFSAVPPGDGGYPSVFEESSSDVPPLHRWDQKVTARGEVTMTWKGFTVVQRSSNTPGLPTYTVSKGGEQIGKPYQDGKLVLKAIADSLTEAINPEMAKFSDDVQDALMAVRGSKWDEAAALLAPHASGPLQGLVKQAISFIANKDYHAAKRALTSLNGRTIELLRQESVSLSEDKVFLDWIKLDDVTPQAKRAWAAIEVSDKAISLANAVAFAVEVISEVNAHTAARALDAAFPGEAAYPDSMKLSAWEVAKKLDYGIEPAFGFAYALIGFAGGSGAMKKVAKTLRAAEGRMFEGAPWDWSDAERASIAERAIAALNKGLTETAVGILRAARPAMEGSPEAYRAASAALVCLSDGDADGARSALGRLAHG